jgi:hypothetical protein
MPGKLSIIGAVAATLMIPTAPSAQMGGAINPGATVRCVTRVLNAYTLASDLDRQFGDVPVGLRKMGQTQPGLRLA